MKTKQEKSVTKYRQGRGWVVSWYDIGFSVWRVSEELTYSAACERVRSLRDNVKQRLADYGARSVAMGGRE